MKFLLFRNKNKIIRKKIDAILTRVQLRQKKKKINVIKLGQNLPNRMEFSLMFLLLLLSSLLIVEGLGEESPE